MVFTSSVSASNSAYLLSEAWACISFTMSCWLAFARTAPMNTDMFSLPFLSYRLSKAAIVRIPATLA